MEINTITFVVDEWISAVCINLLFPQNVLSFAATAYLRDSVDPTCQTKWTFTLKVNIKRNSDCNDSWMCKIFWIMRKTTLALDENYWKHKYILVFFLQIELLRIDFLQPRVKGSRMVRYTVPAQMSELEVYKWQCNVEILFKTLFSSYICFFFVECSWAKK